MLLNGSGNWRIGVFSVKGAVRSITSIEPLRTLSIKLRNTDMSSSLVAEGSLLRAHGLCKHRSRCHPLVHSAQPAVWKPLSVARMVTLAGPGGSPAAITSPASPPVLSRRAQ